MIVTEKHFIIKKMNSILYELDADTVYAIYSVVCKIHQKRNGGNQNETRREKGRNHQYY